MKKIREFNSLDDFYRFVHQNHPIEIGRGAEGYAFLADPNTVIKVMNGRNIKPISEWGNLILDGDYDTKNFYFPSELYVVNNNLVGYKAAFFNNNIFVKGFHVDKDMAYKLLKARDELIKDIEILTKAGYYLFDIQANLLFNGNNFGVIDTLNFYNDPKKARLVNVMIFDHAINKALVKNDKDYTDYAFGENLSLSLKKNNVI